MSQAITPRQTRALAPARPKLRRRDKEFLPAAIELLETPPSPIALMLIGFICVLVGSAIGWAYYSRIDIIAVAAGATRPAGQSKTVEPLETGRVQTIPVAEGQRVKAGDVLLELDATEAKADAASALSAYASATAEAVRRTAAMSAITASGLVPPKVVWPADVPDQYRERETNVLNRDLDDLAAQIDSAKAQMAEKQAQRDRLAATVDADNRLIATLQQRVDMRAELLNTNSGSKASVIDALQTIQSEQTTLAGNVGMIAEAEASVRTLAADIIKAEAHFVSENAQKRVDAARRADEAFQHMSKALAAVEHRTLRSPIDGVVQGLDVHSIGQVVTTGQQVMRVVPENAPLEILAYVTNQDIGFVKDGQDVTLKFESFPFVRYGTIPGHIEHLSVDSIPRSMAQRMLSDSVPSSSRAPVETDPTKPVELVYPVVIRPDVKEFRADGRSVPIAPGMSVSVEIKTGSRRILAYLLSPLVQAGSEIMRER